MNARLRIMTVVSGLSLVAALAAAEGAANPPPAAPSAAGFKFTEHLIINRQFRRIDGQWQGIICASDGNVCRYWSAEKQRNAGDSRP
jgi:hypothetical protein